VEVHADWWWRARYESMGLVYSPDLARLIRKEAQRDSDENGEIQGQLIGQHIYLTMQVSFYFT
jgi:hypothetical protein